MLIFVSNTKAMNRKLNINIEAIEKFYRIDEDGAVFSFRKNKYLKPIFNSYGYLYVYLNTEETPPRWYAVHRLVATKYLGSCPDNKETSHKDGNKYNNHFSNLEYATHRENVQKAYSEHGRNHYWAGKTRSPFADATKEKMSNAKKKRVILSSPLEQLTLNSIEETALFLNTYRKKVYLAIKQGKNIAGYAVSFIDE